MLTPRARYVLLETLPIAIGVLLMMLFFSVAVWNGAPPTVLVAIAIVAIGARAWTANRSYRE